MHRTTNLILMIVLLLPGSVSADVFAAQGPAPKALPNDAVTAKELQHKPVPVLGSSAKISAQSVHLTEISPTATAVKCVISGTVRDAKGAVLAGTSVRVVETGSGVIHTLTTDAAGRYCGMGLAPGRYAVLFDRAGFRSTRLDALTIAAGHAPQADIAMTATEPVVGESAPGSVPGSAPGSVPGTVPFPAPEPVPVKLEPPAPQLPEVSQPVHSDPAYKLGEQEAAWFQQLKNGSIVYDVPSQMTLGDPQSVSVTIYGYKAAAPASNGNQTQPSQLKVAEFMRVEISQADNPNEFTIVHGDNPDEQFVPLNGSQTWTWTVTPNHTGDNQKLKFRAFVIYKDPAQKVQQPLDSKDKTVTVGTRSIGDLAHDAKDNFWLHPMNWVKYVLPGGGGFVILGLLIGWLNKRKKKDADK